MQKYNRYIDLLPERRAVVLDLNPLHRDFCWHLARDFYLSAEGKVSICKQDPYAKRAPYYSLAKLSPLEIWKKQEAYHIASIRGEWDKIPMPCKKCDEWYTCNA